MKTIRISPRYKIWWFKAKLAAQLIRGDIYYMEITTQDGVTKLWGVPYGS